MLIALLRRGKEQVLAPVPRDVGGDAARIILADCLVLLARIIELEINRRNGSQKPNRVRRVFYFTGMLCSMLCSLSVRVNAPSIHAAAGGQALETREILAGARAQWFGRTVQRCSSLSLCLWAKDVSTCSFLGGG